MEVSREPAVWNGGKELPVIYLKSFHLPTREDEERYFDPAANPKIRRTCYTTKYPFHVFRRRNLPDWQFSDVTILCGGNGSGKSTILNVIAEKLRIRRGAAYNRSDFFEDYVKLCISNPGRPGAIPQESRIITSDDVFDYLLDVRSINQGIDKERAALFDKWLKDRYEPYQLKSLDDYEEFRERSAAKNQSQSQYVRERLMRNVQERSNGESALLYFTDSVRETALYLLDEPENSLAAARQLELKDFIQQSARFFGCQFIIATHSPFLLSIEGAKIYDLDEEPVRVRNWWELENVRTYQKYFASNAKLFDAPAEADAG